MLNVFTIIDWVISLTFLMFSGFLFYVFFKYTREIHKNPEWSKEPGGWIIVVLPYWIVKLIWAFLGLLCLYMSFGYLYNVILFPN